MSWKLLAVILTAAVLVMLAAIVGLPWIAP
jgi:hypothetical protein